MFLRQYFFFQCPIVYGQKRERAVNSRRHVDASRPELRASRVSMQWGESVHAGSGERGAGSGERGADFRLLFKIN